MTSKQCLGLVRATYESWSEHNAPRLGAALAYYMLLSMAPLLILLVTIVGIVLTENTARQQILVQVHSVMGAAGERTIRTLIDNAREPKAGIFATVIALITLLSGASGVFLELRESLNIIWDAPKSGKAGIGMLLWQRITSFGMVLALGLLLLVSLLLSAAMTAVGNLFMGFIPVHLAIFGQIANFILPLLIITVLFALIYKFVPDVPIDWRDVMIGALVTAILFSIGKSLLAWYLGTAGVGSTYGAAGSLVALVVWVYYSAQIFFFGAAFTRCYAQRYGSLSETGGSNQNRPASTANLVARQQNA